MGIARKSISDQYNDGKPTPPITLIANKKFALEYTSHDYGLDKIIMLRYLWLERMKIRIDQCGYFWDIGYEKN